MKSSKIMNSCTFVVLVVSPFACSLSHLNAAEFRVLPGDDVKAVVAQADAVRRQKPTEPIDIVFAKGDHEITVPLFLHRTKNPIGDGQAATMFRGEEGARVLGGTRVGPWRDCAFKGSTDTWCADVPKDVERIYTFHADIEIRTECRYPNFDPEHPETGGWLFIPGKMFSMYSLREGERKDRIPMRAEDWKTWAKPSEGRVNIFPRYNWWNRIPPIAAADEATHTLHLAGDTGEFPRPADRFYLIGLREELDAPNEWYFDADAHRIWFIPPAGMDPNKVRTAITTTTQPVFNFNDVGNVHFRDLEICEGGGGIKLYDGSRNCTVTHCTIHDTGWFAGCGIQTWGSGIVIRECRVWNTGNSGVQVHSLRDASPAAYAPGHVDGNEVSFCHIHHTGRINGCGECICGAGQGTRIVNNLLHHAPRGAISFGGRMNDISRNRIHDTNFQSEDTGAIYTGGYVNNAGTKINDNWISDSYGFSHGGTGVWEHRKADAFGIYLDDSSGGAEVVGNLVERCTQGAIFFHSARFNTVSNNFFISNGGFGKYRLQITMNGFTTNAPPYLKTAAQDQYDHMMKGGAAWTNYPSLRLPPTAFEHSEGMLMIGNQIVNNVVYYPDQPESFYTAPGQFAPKATLFDRNVIWCGKGNRVRYGRNFKEIPAEKWAEMGQDLHSVVADPLFVDPARGDYSFKPDSPALKLGIRPFKVSHYGPNY